MSKPTTSDVLEDAQGSNPRAPARPKAASYVGWLREPLLHFLFRGALIFAIYALLNPAASGTDDVNRIELTKDDLRQLALQWIAQGRPAPNPDEMRDLVEQKVSEEILSREAVALGLEKNDEIIRRRLA